MLSYAVVAELPGSHALLCSLAATASLAGRFNHPQLGMWQMCCCTGLSHSKALASVLLLSVGGRCVIASNTLVS